MSCISPWSPLIVQWKVFPFTHNRAQKSLLEASRILSIPHKLTLSISWKTTLALISHMSVLMEISQVLLLVTICLLGLWHLPWVKVTPDHPSLQYELCKFLCGTHSPGDLVSIGVDTVLCVCALPFQREIYRLVPASVLFLQCGPICAL